MNRTLALKRLFAVFISFAVGGLLANTLRAAEAPEGWQ